MTFPPLKTSDSTPLSITIQNNSGLELPFSEVEMTNIAMKVLSGEGTTNGVLEMIYMTPEDISKLNRDFLGNTYVTDNIAFRYEEEGDPIEATIAQCPFRINEQAIELGIVYPIEFMRVLIHGLLHVCGYDDSTEELKDQMTQKENGYLTELGIL